METVILFLHLYFISLQNIFQIPKLHQQVLFAKAALETT